MRPISGDGASRRAASSGNAVDDPQRLALYRAEDNVAAHIGPTWRRWSDVEAALDAILRSDSYRELFPDSPTELLLARRSRSARASFAQRETGTIAIRDGSWNAITLLHELAHIVTSAGPPHGRAFVDNEVALVRDVCGFEAALVLGASLRAHRIEHDERWAARPLLARPPDRPTDPLMRWHDPPNAE